MIDRIREAWGWSVRHRLLVYAMLSFTLFFMSLLVGVVSGRRAGVEFNNVRGDGRYYYLYLPSVVLDGDLDFANQILASWERVGPILGPVVGSTGTGLVPNKYPIGTALTLLPSYLVGHAVTLSSRGRIPADGYSWPYQAACLAMIATLLWGMLVRIDRLLVGVMGVETGPTMAAVLTIVLATPCAYYAFREPFMSHVISAFWCTELAWTVAARSGSRSFWARLGITGAMALVVRPTNVFLLPLAALGVWRRIAEFGRDARVGLALLSLALVPIALQAWSLQIIYGSWLTNPYVDEGFYFWRPRLIETLVSGRHGLLFWSPVVTLSLWALLQRARNPILGSWLVSAAVLWYLNSAWHQWWFGHAYGARAFVELTALFGVGLGLCFQAWRGSPRRIALVAGAAVLLNAVGMALYITERIPPEGLPFLVGP